MDPSSFTLAQFFLEEEHNAIVPRMHYTVVNSVSGQQPLTYDIVLDPGCHLFPSFGYVIQQRLLIFHYDDPMAPRPFATNPFLKVTSLCHLLKRYMICESSPTTTCLCIIVRPDVEEIAAAAISIPLLRVTWGL